MSEKSMLYDELPFWSAPFGLLLIETVRYRKNIRVLDIGCGSGFPMLELAGRLGSGSEVYGLDPSGDDIEMLGAKIELRGAGNAFAIRAAGESMPFGDGYFDLVISNNGLNNVDDMAGVLKECHRVCKPGAQMVLTMNLPYTMIEFYDALRSVLSGMDLNERIEAMDAHIFEKRKPVDYLQELIRESGFHIRSVQLDGFKYRFATARAFYDHYLIKNFFLPSWKKFLPSALHEQVFTETAVILDRDALENGNLEISVPFVCIDADKVAR